jgi:hypothetical protein
MIAASLLLILAAAGMLVVGLVKGSDPMLYGSIVASVLAAVTLVAGVRRVARRREEEEAPIRSTHRDAVAEPTGESGRRGRRYAAAQAVAGGRRAEGGAVSTLDADEEPTLAGRLGVLSEPEPSHPDLSGGGYPGPDYDDEYEDNDPPDEPPAQLLSAADAARVARMSADVLVVDGRPRYHLAGCVHLLGRGESEPLPVAEAVELGFTPCSLCEPDSALLAEARRV